MLNKMSIKLRMVLILAAIVLLFAIMNYFVFSISGQVRDLGLEEAGKIMVENQKAKVEVASHAMALAISEAIGKTGLTEREDKVELIRAMVGSIRFEEDSSGYFFVYEKTVNVAFPVNAENQGKDLGNLKDKNGVHVILRTRSRIR